MATARVPEDWRGTIQRARELARTRDPAAFDLLLPALGWRYDPARNEAIKLLANFGDGVVPHLLRTIEGAETAVERHAAEDALGRMDRRRAIRALLQALAGADIDVRRAACLGLLRLNAREAVRPICRLLLDPSGGVRALAAQVLGRFRDPAAVPVLVHALRDEEWYVRHAAAAALGELRDPRTVAGLTGASRDPLPAVASAARASLAAMVPGR